MANPEEVQQVLSEALDGIQEAVATRLEERYPGRVIWVHGLPTLRPIHSIPVTQAAVNAIPADQIVFAVTPADQIAPAGTITADSLAVKT